ncbi:MAG: hypothetical protein J7M24_05875, partial [Candidatus Latescibacteria bacterium]|nr:hypothetical protein [Candidatus Latescibacterota bacterium]
KMYNCIKRFITPSLFPFMLLFPASTGHALDFSTVSAIAYDDQRDDIILGLEGAVIRWRESTGITAIYDLMPFAVSVVNEMAVSADGALWLAADNGVLRHEGGAWTQFNTENGLPDNKINTIAIAPNGDVWVGTKYGAGRYDGTAWHAFTKSGMNGLSDIDILKIVVDDNNIVWFGTNTGLTRYDGKEWKKYFVSSGLLGKSVRSLLVDRDNNLWVASSTTTGGGYDIKYKHYI